MLSARNVVPPHVAGKRDVLVRGSSHERRAERQSPHLRGAKVLDDPGARIGCRAPIENSFRRQSADGIRPVVPPLRAFGACFIQFSCAVGLRKAGIQRHPLARDDRPGAVVYLAVVLVLCEAKMDHRAKIVTGLRLTAADHPVDLTAYGIRRTRVVLCRVSKEGCNIPECSEADSKDVRVLRRKYDLIEQLRIESVLDADLSRVRRAWKWIRGTAFRPCPITARDRRPIRNLAVHGLGTMRRERRFGRIEAHRFVRHGICVDEHRARIDTAGIDDATHDEAGDRRPIGILRNRDCHPLVIVGRSRPARIIALPSAAQTDVAIVAMGRVNRNPAATVRHVLPHEVAALRHVDGLHEIEARDVLDLAIRVARSQLDVVDDRVVWIVRIEFAEGAARQRFISARRAE